MVHLLLCRNSFRHACVFHWSTDGPSTDLQSGILLTSRSLQSLLQGDTKKSTRYLFQILNTKCPSGRLKNLIRVNQIVSCSGKEVNVFLIHAPINYGKSVKARLVRPENRTYGQTGRAK